MLIVYYHIFKYGNNWRKLVDEQLARVKASGLYDKADIYVGAHGPNGRVLAQGCYDKATGIYIPEIFQEYPKIKTSYDLCGDRDIFEFDSIDAVRELAIQNPQAKILYFHTKGISHPNDYMTDWRNCLEYYTIDKHQFCLDKLNTYDVVGTDLYYAPQPHFSGNFWWANASHLAKLPKVSRKEQGFLLRVNAEMWVCSRHGNFGCLHYNKLHNYEERNPTSNYINLDLEQEMQEASRFQAKIAKSHIEPYSMYNSKEKKFYPRLSTTPEVWDC